MEGVIALMIPIVGMLCTIALPIGLGMYMGIKGMRQKHIEKMELIKQGIVPAATPKSTPNSLRSLRNGMLCVGIALGCLTSFFITGSLQLTKNLAVTGGCILLFLGIAYIAFYFLSKDKMDAENNEG